jgi:hypothetical protein
MSSYTLEVVSDEFAICRIDANAEIPEWAQGEFVSITRTPYELTIVCRQSDVPDGIRCDVGWRNMRLVGPFELSEIGVLSRLARPLAAAGISVFVIGTFDTDYLLVRNSDLSAAIEALRSSGHSVVT